MVEYLWFKEVLGSFQSQNNFSFTPVTLPEQTEHLSYIIIFP